MGKPKHMGSDDAIDLDDIFENLDKRDPPADNDVDATSVDLEIPVMDPAALAPPVMGPGPATTDGAIPVIDPATLSPSEPAAPSASFEPTGDDDDPGIASAFDSIFGGDEAPVLGAPEVPVLEATEPVDPFSAELDGAFDRALDAPALDAPPPGAPSLELGAELGDDALFAPAAPMLTVAADAVDLSTDPEWYVAIEDEQIGPLSVAEVKARWEAGEISPDNLVWRSGLDDWEPLSRVRELKRQILPPAMLTPPPGAPGAPGGVSDGTPPGGTQVKSAPAQGSFKPAAASLLASLAEEEMAAIGSAAKVAGAGADPVRGRVRADEPTEMLPVGQTPFSAPGGLNLNLPPPAAAPVYPTAQPQAAAPMQAPVMGGAPLAPGAATGGPMLGGGGGATTGGGLSTGKLVGILGVFAVLIVGGVAFTMTGSGSTPAAAPPAAAPTPAAPAAATAPPPAPAAEVAAAGTGEKAPGPEAPSDGEGAKSPDGEAAPKAEAAPAPTEAVAKASAPAAATKRSATRPAPKRKSSASAAPAPAAAPAPEPKKRKAVSDDDLFGDDDDDDLDDLFADSGSKKAAPSRPSRYIPPAVGTGKSVPKSLDRSQVFGVVARKKGDFNACTTKQQAAEPSRHGRAVIVWKILPSGGTSGAHCKAGVPKTFCDCALGVVRSMKFPRYGGTQMPPIEFPFPY